jgi:hypothetical protein
MADTTKRPDGGEGGEGAVAPQGGVQAGASHYARAVTEPLYALSTYAAVVFVGDPILVVLLHAAVAAAAVLGAIGSRLAPDIQHVAQITRGNDATFIAQAALACALNLFMAAQVLAAPTYGLTAYLAVSALAAACGGLRSGGLRRPPDAPPQVSSTVAPLALAVCGALLCRVGAGKTLVRGPSMFPITEFDGVTACILLFAAMTASNELRSIESSRNERIAVLDAERKEALDAAAVLPVAEAPQPPPQPPTAFDPFSRGCLQTLLVARCSWCWQPHSAFPSRCTKRRS